MKKIQAIFAVILALCLVLILVSSLIIAGMAGRLPAENAASRWSGDGTRMAQLSAFVSEYAELSPQTVEHGMASSIDKGLQDASIAAPAEDARLYAMGYSSEGNVTLSLTGDYGKTVKKGVPAVAVACGADYFIFHPLKMLSGHYFSTTDILNDCIVIDNDIAWQLFGSYDVVGRMIKINDRECYISGVCESTGDGEYAEFCGDTPRIFLPYTFAEEILGTLPVTAVSVVMPDPVNGFAMKIFEDALPISDEDCEKVENSARFGDTYLRSRLLGVSSRGTRTKAIAYPYYENTAIKLVDWASGVYLMKLVPTVIIILITLAELVILYAKRRAIFTAVSERVKRLSRDIKQNKRRKTKAQNSNKYQNEEGGFFW